MTTVSDRSHVLKYPHSETTIISLGDSSGHVCTKVTFQTQSTAQGLVREQSKWPSYKYIGFQSEKQDDCTQFHAKTQGMVTQINTFNQTSYPVCTKALQPLGPEVDFKVRVKGTAINRNRTWWSRQLGQGIPPPPHFPKPKPELEEVGS